jgi:F0F1-type ATP synthase membrane subunit c/vacuolar-type H+-ATPase subunit K
MLIITSVKLLVLGFTCITLAGGAIGTAVLFGSYCLAVSKNPDEAESLFNSTLMGFALVETFIFMSFLVAGIALLVIIIILIRGSLPRVRLDQLTSAT